MRKVSGVLDACNLYSVAIIGVAVSLGSLGCTKQPYTNQPINYNFNYKEDITNTVNRDNAMSTGNTSASATTKRTIKIKKEGPKKVVFSQENYYPLSEKDVGIEESHGKLFLEIHSFQLQKFMQGEVFLTKRQTQIFSLNNAATKITNIEGRINTYKYSQKPEAEASINTSYQRYALKPKTPTRFEIVIDKIPYKFNTTGCRVVISKQLIDTFAQSKEITINLDFKRELRNKATFDLFLECPR
ncbi:cell surface protein [Helicobacter baculiformis]|uniref:Cell surface protein n=1 Tax=Helicobacter baculiformis TaxID=427351 RepID=A0ABV7ZJ82_9HELI|nr:cell surface protein [Helicobacter baculiformis]